MSQVSRLVILSGFGLDFVVLSFCQIFIVMQQILVRITQIIFSSFLTYSESILSHVRYYVTYWQPCFIPQNVYGNETDQSLNFLKHVRKVFRRTVHVIVDIALKNVWRMDGWMNVLTTEAIKISTLLSSSIKYENCDKQAKRS